MPDLLLELRSEEIPARMQRKAAGDLRKMVTDGLVEAGLTYEAAREYWTPRRLALDLRGVTARSKDVREEIKGPSTKAPEQAVHGFLRKAGLASVEEAEIRSDPKKGDFYVAVLSKPGRAAEAIIAALVPEVIRAFPWPKSMRWGAASGPKGRSYGGTEGRGGETLRWVRPLQSILCTFGPETSDPVVVDFEVDGIRSGNITFGHRFHAPGPITVRRFDDYVTRLEAAKVVLDAERRKQIILSDAKNLAFAAGLELVEDEGLLEEVAGLVEWPVVLMGEFEEAFLDIPAEIIRLTIRANQKCFVARPRAPVSSSRGEIGQSALSNRFILTANIEARDGGVEIAHGNGKVVRARLSDAVHFWKTDQADLPDLDQLQASAEKLGLDLAKPLDQRMARLDHLGVTFHAKLGTQGQRVERIARLAEELAPTVMKAISPLVGEMGGSPEGGAVPPISPRGDEGRSTLPPSALPGISPSRGEITALARRAALLAKADLQTEVVGEFPELQGAMGRRYALLQGEDPSVAAAIEEHYRPQGPSDVVPADPVSIAVALADKLDTLVGFWAIDEKPTGSKDPYALRRAALGVVRILVENGVRLRLNPLCAAALLAVRFGPTDLTPEGRFRFWYGVICEHGVLGARFFQWLRERPHIPVPPADAQAWEDARSQFSDLLSFFHDRLKVYLRDKGARHDLIDAVLASSGAPISPLVGEMSAQPTEGGAVPPTSPEAPRSTLPPSALPGISPTGGEIGQLRTSASAAGAANDDLLLIVRRVEALGALLETETGRNLLAGTRRAVNILAAEEKKGTRVAASVDPALLREDAEKALFHAVDRAESEARRAIAAQDYAGAMSALGALRDPVDAFFEAVLVNDEDEAVRANRLALLARIRAATGQVADFSRIAG